jgi:hypothetical protein
VDIARFEIRAKMQRWQKCVPLAIDLTIATVALACLDLPLGLCSPVCAERAPNVV